MSFERAVYALVFLVVFVVVILLLLHVIERI